MEKIGIKIPMLAFFLGVVYYTSRGFGVTDAIVRSFMFGIGIALIMLIYPLALMFVMTLQRNHFERPKASIANDKGPNVPLREKKVEAQV